MATYTPNINLVKPNNGEPIDVVILNSNSDILDTQISTLETGKSDTGHTHTPESIGAATAAQGTLADNALPKSGGAMTGVLTAQANTSYTTRQVRNMILSTANPTSGDGQNGDIWIKY